MAIKKLTLSESMWSLWLLAKDQWPSLTFYAGAVGLAVNQLWKNIELMALQMGVWVYPFVFALIFLAAVGVAVLAMIFRGQIGFKDIIENELKMRHFADTSKLRMQFNNLKAQIIRLKADHEKKLSQIMSQMNSIEDADARRGIISGVEGEHRALFYERFGSDIMELQAELKRAGALSAGNIAPIFAFETWPETRMQELDDAISTLERLHAD